MDVPPTVVTHRPGAPAPGEPAGPDARVAIRVACRLALVTPVLWLLVRGTAAGLRGDVLPAAAALVAVGWICAVVMVLAAGIAASAAPPFAAGRLRRH